MVCPNCMVQMHQKNEIGGGFSETDTYVTWELKECPDCGRLYIEFYSAIEVTTKTALLEIEDQKELDSYVLNLVKGKLS